MRTRTRSYWRMSLHELMMTTTMMQKTKTKKRKRRMMRRKRGSQPKQTREWSSHPAVRVESPQTMHEAHHETRVYRAVDPQASVENNSPCLTLQAQPESHRSMNNAQTHRSDTKQTEWHAAYIEHGSLRAQRVKKNKACTMLHPLSRSARKPHASHTRTHTFRIITREQKRREPRTLPPTLYIFELLFRGRFGGPARRVSMDRTRLMIELVAYELTSVSRILCMKRHTHDKHA